MQFADSQFWVSLLQIIGIDILLSGDNAVVIALACRSLPPAQQRVGIMLGTGAAIGLRILFASGIVVLLAIPYLQMVGGLLLFWVAIKLLMPEEENDGHVAAGSNLWAAVRTIMIADAVMSLDNVIGIAAVAKGDILLLVLGLLISIPLIVWGSTLILRLLARAPWIVLLGAGLLGYVAGDIFVSDPTINGWLAGNQPWLLRIAGPVGAVFVVVVGKWLAARRAGS